MVREMPQTAWGSLFRSLRLREGERLLIRGGGTSLGFAAAAIAKPQGAVVASAPRKKEGELHCERPAPIMLLSIAAQSRARKRAVVRRSDQTSAGAAKD